VTSQTLFITNGTDYRRVDGLRFTILDDLLDEKDGV